eukprot:gene12408-16641_t
MSAILLLAVLLFCFLQKKSADDLAVLNHPLNHVLFEELNKCRSNISYCESQFEDINRLLSKIAIEHSILLLHEKALELCHEIFYYVEPNSKLGQRTTYVLAVLSFAQGNFLKAKKHLSILNEADVVSQRTAAAQIIISGSESQGIQLMLNYTNSLRNRFIELTDLRSYDNSSLTFDTSASKVNASEFSVRTSSSSLSEDLLLEILLNEANGAIRATAKLSDLSLSFSEIRIMDAKLRFRLGVGLAKLGLFDLSLRHVWLAATPWEAPLYKLRAKLVFSPVHSSLRALSSAVNNFERQAESILLNDVPRSPLMIPVCNSLNEAALALQSLPLLHLAGVSAPRQSFILGHSPIALPALLSEVFQLICPSKPIPQNLTNLLQLQNN